MVIAWTALKYIFRSQHRDEAPSSILYQSYGCYSQDLVLSRRGDGCRNCLLITEHMNTINTRVIAITKSIQMLIADTIQNLQMKTTFLKLFLGAAAQSTDCDIEQVIKLR